MKNKNKTVWSSRFNNTTSKIFEQIGASIDVDKRLFEEDIFASIVHAQMLVKQKIINKKGEEFARIIGEVNFQDKKFLKWLLKYD